MGQKGIIQQDIPKLRNLIGLGHSAAEIAKGMLGYLAPEAVIQSFIDKGVPTVEARPEHPQDKAARIRREIDDAKLAALKPPVEVAVEASPEDDEAKKADYAERARKGQETKARKAAEAEAEQPSIASAN